VSDQKGNTRVRTKVALGLVLALVAGTFGFGALAGPVAAGVLPTADAFVECRDGEGFILVEIVDEFSTTYNVYIDDELVDADVTDSDGGFYSYGPYADGVHNVRVDWLGEELEILNVDVTIDCPDATTTTAAPTTTAAAATTAAPRFTG
jgi:hypothetical protein